MILLTLTKYTNEKSNRRSKWGFWGGMLFQKLPAVKSSFVFKDRKKIKNKIIWSFLRKNFRNWAFIVCAYLKISGALMKDEIWKFSEKLMKKRFAV